MEDTGKHITGSANDKNATADEDLMTSACYYDPMFHVTILYAYGSFGAYSALEAKLFPAPEKTVSARSCCAFGDGVESIGTMVGLVWVNSRDCKFENSLPRFLHEITHLSQAILDNAGVKDSSGEVQAYLVEREFIRLVHEMSDTKPLSTKATCAIESILNDLFGPDSAEKHPTIPLSELLGLSTNNNHNHKKEQHHEEEQGHDHEEQETGHGQN